MRVSAKTERSTCLKKKDPENRRITILLLTFLLLLETVLLQENLLLLMRTKVVRGIAYVTRPYSNVVTS